MTSRLAKFEITGLFGLYDHTIDLRLTERITIVIGPNGRGKTVCLKFIEALFGSRFSYFRDIPFKAAKFTFTEGQIITVRRGEPPKSPRPLIPIELSLELPSGSVSTCIIGPVDDQLNREIRKYIPSQYRRIDDNVWEDQTDGEVVDLDTLISRHPMPQKLMNEIKPLVPQEIQDLLSPIDCHLIETQRLLVLPSAVEDPDPWHRSARRPGGKLAIQEKAEKLKSILRDKLTESATMSQSLDRTFPRRVFDAQGKGTLSETQLREELTKLDNRRKGLMQAGILDTSYEPVAVSSANIDPGVVRVLEIYVQDTFRKLSIFDDLRARVDLFKQLLGERFTDKNIQIDRETGFKISSKTLAQVPLDKLSSGEQHQLILIFDLLFEVKRNSLILIDEPELSLHVAWQKTFITSLEQIINLNNFDVLLATHSPALVSKHFDLAVELGPVDE